MGWLAKSLAFLLALILVGAGVWEVSLIIFAALFLPPLLRMRKRSASRDGESPKSKFPFKDALGGLLVLFALFGYLAHGVLSPFVFGSLGALLILWGRVPLSPLASRFAPVPESVLLKSSPLPFSWAAVAQVKLLTRDAGRALAGVQGTVLVSASEVPSIYLVVERRSTSERSAEQAIFASLRETALSLSTLGGYLLPLDSKEACALFQPPLAASRPVGKDWSNAVSSGAYDVLVISQENGFAKSLGTYGRATDGHEGHARIPSLSQEFAHPPFLMEVYKSIAGRLAWPHPDQYTAFLSSLLATSNEPVGTRIMDAGAASQSQLIAVKSQGSPPVELSHGQLRAVVRMYDKGTS